MLKPCIWLFLLSITVNGWQNLGTVVWADEEVEKDDLFLFPPNTPSRQIRGAILAERLNRTDLAQRYLNQVIEAQLPTQELLKLRQEFGIGQFLKLSAIRELQPTSRELLRLVNDATKQESPSAAAVEVLIRELGQSEQQTLDASLRILSAEDAAVAPLLSVETSTPEGKIASLLLKKYARRFRFGLLKELPNAGEALQVRILNLLSQTTDRGLAIDLSPYRFAESASVSAAANKACQQLSGTSRLPTSAAETAEQLVDHSLSLLAFAATPFPTVGDRREAIAKRTTSSATTEPAAFGTVSIARSADLSRLAAELVPDDPAISAAQLVTEITAQSWPTKWPAGIAVPTPTDAPTPASDTEVAAMQIAIDSQNPASILALLGRIQTATSVLAAKPDLLRACTLQSDPRVRLIASAIRNALDGESTYSRQVLQNAVNGSNKPEAVVIDSRTGESRGTAAVLKEAGYDAVATGSGQAGFGAATHRIHCELILIQSNCLRWPLTMTITNLRKDYRTKNTPIVIYGPERDRTPTDTVRNTFDGIWFLTEPISEVTFADTARLAGIPGPILSEEERSQMINFARDLTATK